MIRTSGSSAATADWLRELADAPPLTVFGRLDASPKGLTEPEAAERLARYRDNVVDPPARLGAAGRVAAAVRSPFVALLAALGVVFAGLGDLRGALTVAVMVTLSVAVRWWQRTHSERAVAALRDRVSMTTTVRRRADNGHQPSEREVPSHDLVPGDVLLLEPGDLVPADVRVLSATDLVVDQSALSGETMPVSKRQLAQSASDRRSTGRELVDLPALCFVGASVVSATATAVVIATGPNTYAGSIARHTTGERPESSFDRGVRTVGWTLIRFMLVLVPIVLVVNGTVTGDWAQAVMFAMAVAVGLTPEMLPVIVTTNLARGAVRLAHAKVIVKRLNAIQDLGATDVLCVDKTGTLTEDRVVYAHSIDPEGRPDGQAAEYAYLALHFQTGPRIHLDEAVRAQLAEGGDDAEDLLIEALHAKVDEIGFDHLRRRGTVVVRRQPGEHLLITKGDPGVVLAGSALARALGAHTQRAPPDRAQARDMMRAHAEHGMRMLAVAVKQSPERAGRYDEDNEFGL